jgi:hypothetical protein
MTHHTLQSALNVLQDNQIIIAEDVSATGQKHFYTDTINELNAKYLKLRNKHWYECLVEGRPSRLFLDIESNEKIDIQKIINLLNQCVEQHYKKTADIQVLDSCCPTKYSFHIVCTNIVLKNVYHVGAFVRRMVLFMGPGDLRNAIDTAVYTKNRMFRIKDSSKFGSERILKHALKWYQLLVQPETPGTLLECLEIDNQPPVSTSMAPENMFVIGPSQTWTRIQPHRQRGSASQTSCPLLSPVLDWLDVHLEAKTCRHNTKMSINGHYLVMTRSKKCMIAKRTHKGNNIWFDIDIHKQIVIQRCFDEECCQSSEECQINVPSETWSKWITAWSEIICTPSDQRNEITLYNMTF